MLFYEDINWLRDRSSLVIARLSTPFQHLRKSTVAIDYLANL